MKMAIFISHVLYENAVLVWKPKLYIEVLFAKLYLSQIVAM